MTLFLLYLWLKLDQFHDMLSGFIGFCVITTIISLFILIVVLGGDTKDPWYQRIVRFPKWLFPIGIFLILLNVFLPTQRQGAYLIAGYAGMKLVETPEMGKLTELVRLKVGNYLDDELVAAKADAVKAVASAVSK